MVNSEYALIILPKFKTFRQEDVVSTANILQDFAISQTEKKLKHDLQKLQKITL